ncbi:uncharacterized protein N7500_004713 [Penicillium coprophilum]|uniref:uncharacterized protein n=1 Tax=Penicillium coprophilum TaxID=36646 RepID=UPI0023843CF0|nr:uncharacterized protein N7500_004713 [Penicillium coprophilum]KAJ5162883.1 hypothetical protein N7500_004713 [Penicillium coprophilum]
MCVADVLLFVKCYPELSQPLLWHCQYQRERQELHEALIICIQGGDVNATRLLLSINADVETVEDDTNDEGERSPGHDAPGCYWNTSILGWAVRGGHNDIVEALTQHLAQLKLKIPALKVKCMRDALKWAAQGGFLSMIKLLLEIDFGITRSPEYYDNALYFALMRPYGHIDRNHCTCSKQNFCSGWRKKSGPDYYATVKLLLDVGANPNWPGYSPGSSTFSHPPLELALDTCSLISDGTVKLLVERGANVRDKDFLHAFTNASNRCTVYHGETAKHLLDHGANISVRDSLGRSILTKARKRDLIQLYVARGLSPNDVDGSGKTLLGALATEEASESRAELMKVLLELGADVNSRSPCGLTPLHSIFSYRPKPRGYDSEGYEFDGFDRYGRPMAKPGPESPDSEIDLSFVHKTAKLLLTYGADVSARDDEKQTAIYKTDSRSLVELLLAHGAEVNLVDAYGQTPLHTMIYGASPAMVETIKLVLSHGADLHAENGDGNTPLHLASLTSSWEVVKLLLHHGADRNHRNVNGETTLDLLARRRRHREQFPFNRDKNGNRLITYRNTFHRTIWF